MGFIEGPPFDNIGSREALEDGNERDEDDEYGETGVVEWGICIRTVKIEGWMGGKKDGEEWVPELTHLGPT